MDNEDFVRRIEAAIERVEARNEVAEARELALRHLMRYHDQLGPATVEAAARSLARQIRGEFWRRDREGATPSTRAVGVLEWSTSRLSALYAGAQELAATDLESEREFYGCLRDWARRRVGIWALIPSRNLEDLKQLAANGTRLFPAEIWDPGLEYHRWFRPHLGGSRIEWVEKDASPEELICLSIGLREALGSDPSGQIALLNLHSTASRALHWRLPDLSTEGARWLYGRPLRNLLRLIGTYDFVEGGAKDLGSDMMLRRERLAHYEAVDRRLVLLSRLVLRRLGVCDDESDVPSSTAVTPKEQSSPQRRGVTSGHLDLTFPLERRSGRPYSDQERRAVLYAAISSAPMTQRDFAKMTGVPRQTIQKWKLVIAALRGEAPVGEAEGIDGLDFERPD